MPVRLGFFVSFGAMGILRMALKPSQTGGLYKMKYIAILSALAVACLLAVPAMSVADGNMSSVNAKGPGGDCGQCCGSGHCYTGDVMGIQNQYGQDSTGCHGAGNCAGDGNCNGKGSKNGMGYRNGSCDGTGPKRDGSCKAA